TVRPIPFWSFLDWFRGNWLRGGSIALNIILFIPLGYHLAGVWKSKWVPLIICLNMTIAIEVVQYFTYYGYFDTDDIIVNFLGGVIGVFCYQRFGERLKNWPVLVLLILTGIVGCFLVAGNTVIYETQFDFQIHSLEVQNNAFKLSGTCDIYRRDFLPYTIQLKGEGSTYRASTETDGVLFTATAVAPDGEYEVDVVFNGYQPINTKTYIKGDQVQYVSKAPTPDILNTNLEFLLDTGILKMYNADYDAYVYQFDNHLYWLIGKDFDASIIYHLYTEELVNLPEERKQYGFDNRGFRIGSENDITETMDCGAYRVFTDIIPNEYSVTAIAVGMNKGPDIIWREYFRPCSF
ncbi:MAG: VanZ family protein, partial [Oscillospiraceae bacterium]|nr:VanZ family protein [Oscillospiraceae bacterium]